jgi:hypothetical protein
MLATGLPVFSVARGALPESIGRSGAALLARHELVVHSAREFADLVMYPGRLARLCAAGRAYVRED